VGFLLSDFQAMRRHFVAQAALGPAAAAAARVSAGCSPNRPAACCTQIVLEDLVLSLMDHEAEFPAGLNQWAGGDNSRVLLGRAISRRSGVFIDIWARDGNSRKPTDWRLDDEIIFPLRTVVFDGVSGVQAPHDPQGYSDREYQPGNGWAYSGIQVPFGNYESCNVCAVSSQHFPTGTSAAGHGWELFDWERFGQLHLYRLDVSATGPSTRLERARFCRPRPLQAAAVVEETVRSCVDEDSGCEDYLRMGDSCRNFSTMASATTLPSPTHP